ncbi:LCP family protein, partial [Kitasatospora sp. NPDC059571]|uniref:LCP family protein n=1 Tax=Kitasatospora sp. NPDC059571 TaxID=3346871 RepID=UPI00369A2287
APPRPGTPAARPSEQVAGARSAAAKGGDDSYATGEFTFVDEQAEETEDVIDWLKFAESRSEVRAERRRRLRNRLIGLAVTLAVLAGGAGGYLWWTGKLGNQPSAAAAAGGRQVNVVHLRDLQGKVTSALLVDDASGHKGTVLLLPDTLKLPAAGDASSPTVGTGLDQLGPSGTRDGLATVLGAPVAGTWRLDTPYLTLLVAQLGGIKVDTNAAVQSSDGKVSVTAGKGTDLNGLAAALYATYQAPGEGRDAQLARFGQVMEAVIRAMPTGLTDASDDVHRMNAVLDPSLPEKALAGVLAGLAQQAKDGHLSTQVLKAKADGTLDQATAGQQVKDVLGGTVHSASSTTTTPRVSIVNASGNEKLTESVQVQVINAGLESVPSSAKAGAVQAASEIRYTDDARAEAAKALAVTLGLKPEAVKKVTDPQNADLVVVLGKDFPTQPTQ